MGTTMRLLACLFLSRVYFVASFGQPGNNVVSTQGATFSRTSLGGNVPSLNAKTTEQTPLFARRNDGSHLDPESKERTTSLLTIIRRRFSRRGQNAVTAAALFAAWAGVMRGSTPPARASAIAEATVEATAGIAIQPAASSVAVGKSGAFLLGAAGARSILKQRNSRGSGKLTDGENNTKKNKFNEIMNNTDSSSVNAENLIKAAEEMLQAAKKESELLEVNESDELEKSTTAEFIAEEDAAWGRAAAEKAQREMEVAKQVAAEKEKILLIAEKALAKERLQRALLEAQLRYSAKTEVGTVESEEPGREQVELKPEGVTEVPYFLTVAVDDEEEKSLLIPKERLQRALLTAQLRYSASAKVVNNSGPISDEDDITLGEYAPQIDAKADRRLSLAKKDMEIEEQAFAILVNLGLVELTPDPDSPEYDPTYDSEFALQNVWLEKEKGSSASGKTATNEAEETAVNVADAIADEDVALVQETETEPVTNEAEETALNTAVVVADEEIAAVRDLETELDAPLKPSLEKTLVEDISSRQGTRTRIRHAVSRMTGRLQEKIAATMKKNTAAVDEEMEVDGEVAPSDEDNNFDRYKDMALEERAFTILMDLGMLKLTPDPDSADYDPTHDDEFAPENVWLE